jgi:hypothetical protein
MFLWKAIFGSPAAAVPLRAPGIEAYVQRQILGAKTLSLAAMLAFIAMLASPMARADLYAAEAAAKAKDFARAFELFRELAETGNTYAQENLAVMYVNGEGVAREQRAWLRMGSHGEGRRRGRGSFGNRRAARAAFECGRSHACGGAAVAIRESGVAGAPSAEVIRSGNSWQKTLWHSRPCRSR